MNHWIQIEGNAWRRSDGAIVKYHGIYKYTKSKNPRGFTASGPGGGDSISFLRGTALWVARIVKKFQTAEFAMEFVDKTFPLESRVIRHGRFKHGDGGHSVRVPEYAAWRAMRNRCNFKSSPTYLKYYIQRGIRVCDRWMNSYENFLSDMGRKPGPEYSLERINNRLGYEPGNCKWATKSEQSRNTSRTIFITKDGVKKPMVQWAEELNLPRTVIYSRIKKGWPAARLFEPCHRATPHPDASPQSSKGG